MRTAVPTPWMAFYADRFAKETQQLRPLEVAAYYRMFESYAQTGYLLDDPYMLRSIVRLDSELTVIEALSGNKPDYGGWIEFTDNIVKSLLARFFTLEADGAYHHAGWDKELVRARASYDGKVKGANSANDKKKKAAERAAEQGTTNNVERTTVQPTASHVTADSAQATADNPQRPEDIKSDQPTTRSIEPTPESDTVTAGVGRSSGVSGEIIPISREIVPVQTGACGAPRDQERTATGTAVERDQTAATRSAQSDQFTPEQRAEIERHPPGTPKRWAVIQKFSKAA